MEKHQQVKIQQKLLQNTDQAVNGKLNTPELTFQPARASAVPDFKALQERFKQTLDRTKNSKLPTQVQPFAIKDMQEPQSSKKICFEEAPKDPETKSAFKPKTRRNQSQKENKDLTPIESQIKTTKKMEQYNELMRQQTLLREQKDREAKEALDSKAREMSKRASEFRQRYKLGEELTPDDKIQLLTAQKIEERKNREKNYREEMTQLDRKLGQRPSYMERISSVNIERKQFFERVKTLINTYDTLKANNPDVDPQKIFSGEEMRLIEEGKLLERQGKLKC
jgi:hypothetical protein